MKLLKNLRIIVWYSFFFVDASTSTSMSFNNKYPAQPLLILQKKNSFRNHFGLVYLYILYISFLF